MYTDIDKIISTCNWLKDYQRLIDKCEAVEIVIIDHGVIPAKYYNLNSYISEEAEGACRDIIKKGLEEGLRQKEILFKLHANPSKKQK